MENLLGFALFLAGLLIVLVPALLVYWLFRWFRRPRNTIFVDGSNVLYWEDQTPQIAPLHDLVALLKSKGYRPHVMFDANAGYLLVGRYLHNQEFARVLGLRRLQVTVVDKGVPADLELLSAARRHRTRVVTNDMFRDWTERFPEIRTQAHLVHGGYHNGNLWLDFDVSRPRVGATRRSRKRKR